MNPIRFRLKIYAGILLIILTFGIVGIHIAEGRSLFDALYFGIVTIATVGYGDIHPTTVTGKIITLFMIIGGVGTFLGVVANATELILSRRENQIYLQKLHMVLGIFFSEIGTWMLTYFACLDPDAEFKREHFQITQSWTDADFILAQKLLSKSAFKVHIDGTNGEAIRNFLDVKGDFLLRLLENPVLLEHESFTLLLQAIYHLREELLSRDNIASLPASDYAHLSGDARRAYGLIVPQWLGYMKYLKTSYPYLFHLAVRKNPFNKDASPVVL
jgi:voltage-gated potassium channel